ncbi:hypothetical protein EDB81DRAFT_650162 [Dactylonectria macrodidyma]|uniref:Glutamine synthetase n=1 Tax=Dactylonectria macrodidyma TaxID=307937 RepID=A0A9P9EZI8_9HYPO|nr:hypothetical protein EDB81DRAFT_650162 [Dactylonectria macrodidyma]
MTLVKVETEEALRHIINTTPIIDHHAHPLLNLSSIAKYPLLSISTEAHGDAINATQTSLAHLRAVKQLSRILGCEASWEAVSAAVRAKQTGDYDAWVRRCVSGIESILVDDGFSDATEVERYNHFDSFTRSPSKRIVRIEHVAAEIIDQTLSKFKNAGDAFKAVIESFHQAILQSIQDPEVVGFKSVICYRTGLAIPKKMDIKAASEAFLHIFEQQEAGLVKKFTRVDHAGLNEYFVHHLATLIRDSQDSHKKPIQFHTGLGDNDITLTESSPAHLQNFIREYPTVPIVLLHASYPYMREAGYLATVYGSVFVDVGEVFPAVSRDGQEAVIRQILELCPYSKILWSTDGHWFPETYLLAVEQVREVLYTVLTDYVRKEDLTWAQAAHLVEDIFFNNSNKLYTLGLGLKPLVPKTRTDVVAPTDSNMQMLAKLLKGKEEARFLRVYWNDMTAMPRMRAIPIRRVWSLLRNGEELSFGVTKASLGLLQNDVPAPGVSPSGEYRLHPDLNTLRPGPRKGHVTVSGDFKEMDGSAVSLCPRTLLKRTLEKAAQHGLAFVLGFEVELLLVRRVEDQAKYETLDGDGHAWSMGRAMEHEGAAGVLEDAIEQLDAAGVYIDMVHPESANGQYEVILPKAPALEAVDTLLYARDIISNVATAKGFRMTLHPKPFATACGTAAHVHMSISTPNGSDKDVYEPFYAGILKHLRALAAFTYSSLTSYERVQDGCWAGGTWVAWGTQNRETPLRKIEGSHWEMKCMDGMANPYLALSAVLLAGIDGVARQEELAWADCEHDPATLFASERNTLNIRERLPMSISEALKALQLDDELGELLGRDLVERYVAVKTAETGMLEAMGDDERRRWVMERY